MTPLHLLDAFAAGPFTGNPAAVCPLPGPTDPVWMQALASELGFSDTAFTWPLQPTRWQIRWFTPRSEVPICGHATLSTAAALWRSGLVAADQAITFESAAGRLGARRDKDLIWLDFPRRELQPTAPSEALIEAIGCVPQSAWRSGDDVLLELPDAAAVRTCRPDLQLLASLPVRGVAITAVAEDAAESDCVSRFFAPRVGIPEDPVTGSIHCALAPLWAERLKRRRLTAWQASQRGGLLQLRVEAERVHLGGQAVPILSGQLCAPAAPPENE